MASLGRFIKDRRQERGLGLRQFAAKACIAPAFAVDIEAGNRMPSHDVMARIAAVLEVPLGDLEALDPRVTPEVKEWMDGDPGVSTFLRWLCARPDRNDLMTRMMEVAG